MNDFIKRLWRQFCIRRTISALHQLDDGLLRDIGITRAGIPGHVYAVYNEYR